MFHILMPPVTASKLKKKKSEDILKMNILHTLELDNDTWSNFRPHHYNPDLE